MYSPAQIKRGIRRGVSNPKVFAREANRAYYLRLYQWSYNEGGVDLFKEDWDNLIVLDACRYDLFADVADLPGRLSSRQSRGSHTTEFLRGNFNGDLTDTVYVTATPQYYTLTERGAIDGEFHEVVNVWSEGGWNKEYGTVLPETMTEYVREAAERFPDKRILAHYLQPHYPFIDSEEWLDVMRLNRDENEPDIWERLFNDTFDADATTVWDAYERNLERVLPSIRDLLDELSGRTVVTSDHGNVFNERVGPFRVREWGHPPGIHTPNLVTVPWLVHDTDERRRITAGAPSANDVDEGAGVDDDVVSERLRQLGYTE